MRKIELTDVTIIGGIGFRKAEKRFLRVEYELMLVKHPALLFHKMPRNQLYCRRNLLRFTPSSEVNSHV